MFETYVSIALVFFCAAAVKNVDCFYCRSSGDWIPIDWVCDAQADCSDSSDESYDLNCVYQKIFLKKGQDSPWQSSGWGETPLDMFGKRTGHFKTSYHSTLKNSEEDSTPSSISSSDNFFSYPTQLIRLLSPPGMFPNTESFLAETPEKESPSPQIQKPGEVSGSTLDQESFLHDSGKSPQEDPDVRDPLGDAEPENTEIGHEKAKKTKAIEDDDSPQNPKKDLAKENELLKHQLKEITKQMNDILIRKQNTPINQEKHLEKQPQPINSDNKEIENRKKEARNVRFPTLPVRELNEPTKRPEFEKVPEQDNFLEDKPEESDWAEAMEHKFPNFGAWFGQNETF